jgi:hypothetical protein
MLMEKVVEKLFAMLSVFELILVASLFFAGSHGRPSSSHSGEEIILVFHGCSSLICLILIGGKLLGLLPVQLLVALKVFMPLLFLSQICYFSTMLDYENYPLYLRIVSVFLMLSNMFLYKNYANRHWLF